MPTTAKLAIALAGSACLRQSTICLTKLCQQFEGPGVVQAAKDAKAHEKAEDPIYVLEHGLPIDSQHYLEHHLKLPLTRLFEPLMKNSNELLSGVPHLLLDPCPALDLLSSLIGNLLLCSCHLVSFMAVSFLAKAQHDTRVHLRGTKRQDSGNWSCYLAYTATRDYRDAEAKSCFASLFTWAGLASLTTASDG